jgi:hypothetical protein
MGIMRTLRDNLKTILDGVSDFEEVSDEPKLNFDGYPACFIAPSGEQADFLTNVENQRVYAFKVWVFAEYKTTPIGDAYNIAIDAVDAVTNAIDAQESPDISEVARVIDNSIPSGYTLVGLEATPNRFASDEVDSLIAAEITVRCKVTVDLTVI